MIRKRRGGSDLRTRFVSAAATIDYYTGLGLNMMPGNGLLAAVIPGAFDAWMLLLRDYGTMSVREVLEPAIGYAKTACRSCRRSKTRSPTCNTCSKTNGRRRPMFFCRTVRHRCRAACSRNQKWRRPTSASLKNPKPSKAAAKTGRRRARCVLPGLRRRSHRRLLPQQQSYRHIGAIQQRAYHRR